jgi:hypothetical protein
MKKFFDRMKARWGVGLWGMIAILLAFSLAGMSILRVKQPVLGFITPDGAPEWVRWTIYALIILPLYQVLLLFWGTVLGQFRFFWGKIRRTWRFLFGWMLPRATRTESNDG